jgi:mono/diheme cytochrome c family protein
VLKRVVDGLEVVALVAAAIAVVMLFVAQGDDEQEVAAGGDDLGAQVYADRCAGCHGADGGGGAGPPLADGAVVEAFPDEADQIVVVTDGRGGMPAFGDQLSTEEIAAVVTYTRTALAGAAAGEVETTTTTEPPTTTTTEAPPPETYAPPTTAYP